MKAMLHWCLLLCAISLSTCAFGQERRIVFLAGRPSHGYGSHEHLAGSRILADAIQRAAPNVKCEVIPGGWPEDDKVLDGADAIVMYADGGGGHPALGHLDVLGKHIARGVGSAACTMPSKYRRKKGAQSSCSGLAATLKLTGPSIHIGCKLHCIP